MPNRFVTSLARVRRYASCVLLAVGLMVKADRRRDLTLFFSDINRFIIADPARPFKNFATETDHFGVLFQYFPPFVWKN